MKSLFIFLLLLSLSSVSSADTIKKWVDESGKVHYDNTKNTKYIDSAEPVDIKDTFDEDAYNAGLQRHIENEKIGEQYEEERQKEEDKRLELEKNKSVKTPPPSGSSTPYPKATGQPY